MKILVAPDSFKESMTALEVATAIERGIKEVIPEAQVIKVPMADGGEGTVQSLVDATRGKIIKEWVRGPLGEKVEAEFGILGDGKTAVIEMATCSGLPLVPLEKRNPLLTTTYGTGELIRAGLDRGCRNFIIGIGGSATTDGGVGMAQALGGHFLDREGKEVGFGGGELGRIFRIDLSSLDPRISQSKIEVACDVDNPLYGPQGAAYVYSPQKGASPEMVKVLDDNLRNLARVIKRDLGKDVARIPGAGAAGGLGAGLVAFLNARLRRGIEIVLEATSLESYVREVDLVITGEGSIDGSTVYGKTPMGVAKLAKKHNKPVVAIAGNLGEGAEKANAWIDAIFSNIREPMTLEEAIAHSPRLLTLVTAQIIRLLKVNLPVKKCGE